MTKLSALLAVAAAAPAVVAPNLVAPAQAQDAARAEFQDVPRDHWAYDALQRLAAAGVIEGYPPSGDFRGQRAMTRYEFAVAIARLLNRIPAAGTEFDPSEINRRLTDLEGRPIPDVTLAQVNDLIAQLRREFADELARLGAQVDALNSRVTTIENRVTPAPRLTITPSILHHTGYANYINNGTGFGFNGSTGNFNTGGIINGSVRPFTGRSFLNPLQGRGNPLAFNQAAPGTAPTITVFPNVAFNGQNLPPFTFGGNAFGDVTPFEATPRENNSNDDRANKKFSYTDFEIRMTDRVSDRLSLNAAIRSLGSNQEDPWAGDSQANVYVREAYASADLSDRGFLGTRGLSATLGRQRTKIAQGLLYDNDLSPTDQLRLDFNLGPVALSG
ncbi:MAG: S-layer homology domain-containing protein, partial [Armatimonadetes bacterium]|nr:S-layer homology domain-containing protein [Armatimonadota bacterium]